MKKMDEELHRKKKQAEDKEKAIEAEKCAVFDRTDSELVKVKDRLEALEETVKEIADETKKIARSIPLRDTGGGGLGKSATPNSPEAPSSIQEGDRAPAVTSMETPLPHNLGQKDDEKEQPTSGPSDSSKDTAFYQGLRGFAARWIGSIRSR